MRNGENLDLGQLPWEGRGICRSARLLGSGITGRGDQDWGGRQGEEDDAQVLIRVPSGSGEDARNRDRRSGQRSKFRGETNEFSVWSSGGTESAAGGGKGWDTR